MLLECSSATGFEFKGNRKEKWLAGHLGSIGTESVLKGFEVEALVGGTQVKAHESGLSLKEGVLVAVQVSDESPG